MKGRPAFGWLGLAFLIARALLGWGCGAAPDAAPCEAAGTYSTDRCVEVCVSDGFAFGTCAAPTGACARVRAYEYASVVRLAAIGKPEFDTAPCDFGVDQ